MSEDEMTIESQAYDMDDESYSYQDVAPETLMSDINHSSITLTLIISVVVHAALIMILSIGYFLECAKYGAFLPADIKEKKAELAAQEELDAKKKQAAEENAAAEKETADKPKENTGTAEDTSGNDKPKIVKEVEEVIKEQPDKPTSLDGFDDDF